jgi:hypothetical protein
MRKVVLEPKTSIHIQGTPESGLLARSLVFGRDSLTGSQHTQRRGSPRSKCVPNIPTWQSTRLTYSVGITETV